MKPLHTQLPSYWSQGLATMGTTFCSNTRGEGGLQWNAPLGYLRIVTQEGKQTATLRAAGKLFQDQGRLSHRFDLALRANTVIRQYLNVTGKQGWGAMVYYDDTYGVKIKTPEGISYYLESGVTCAAEAIGLLCCLVLSGREIDYKGTYHKEVKYESLKTTHDFESLLGEIEQTFEAAPVLSLYDKSGEKIAEIDLDTLQSGKIDPIGCYTERINILQRVGVYSASLTYPIED